MTILELREARWILFSNSALAAGIVNHLWQSTVFAVAAALLALALRQRRAAVRYWLWFVASMKFLLPFSVLIAAGAVLHPAIPFPAPRPPLAAALDQVTEPYSQYNFVVASASPVSARILYAMPMLLFVLWFFGAAIVLFRWIRQWKQLRAVAQEATPLANAAGIPVLSTASLIEPGMFGIVRPVLLLPAGIVNRLSPAQMDAIVAHELCHLRRRDNLTFALHMAVEALFWFHPLVWWIGARLIEEREHACDEWVLQAGKEAETYAEGILSVCRFCVESPLGCAAGVTGADLKKRIVRIMTHRGSRGLGLAGRLLLCAAGLLAAAFPLSFGLLHGARVRAQAQSTADKLPAFEVSTIKPNKSDDGRMSFMFTPDGISLTGVPVQMLLREAFNVEDDGVVGAPAWVKSDRIDVQAKVNAADAPRVEKLTIEQRRAMLQPLLADRLNLKVHHEMRELPVYSLTLGKSGSKLKEAVIEGATPEAPQGRRMVRLGNGDLEAHGANLETLTHLLSQQLGRTVIDKTGLSGLYDFSLKWTPDNGGAGPAGPGAEGGPPAPDPNGPSLFTAIQEQLGLKLESTKGPVDVIVIDHIDKPSEN